MARVEADAGAVLDDLEAKAVKLRFVQPIVAIGWANGCRGVKGTDEGETGGEHASDLAPSRRVLQC